MSVPHSEIIWLKFVEDCVKTRMHSSMTRTTCLPTVCVVAVTGGVWSGGNDMVPWGYGPRGYGPGVQSQGARPKFYYVDPPLPHNYNQSVLTRTA